MNSIVGRQAAEWHVARVVLLCEPRLETALGLLAAGAQNFLRPFALSAAKAEHRRFREALEARGARAIDLREALTAGCESDPTALARLRGWARSAIEFAWHGRVTAEQRQRALESADHALRGFSPEMLAEIVLLRPIVRLALNPHALDDTTALTAAFELRPATNSYYMRDPLITSAAGCTIGRLRLAVRQPENDIAAHALEQLGIQPICRVHAPGTLEGGDFIPCGDFALQGQGLLTNAAGVAQCLAAGAYGKVEVGVVRDSREQMDEMHLDSYFVVFDRDLCALCENRFGVDEPAVDVYEPRGGDAHVEYVLSRTVGFTVYLESKGMRVLRFSVQERDAFAPNGLLTGPRRYLCPQQSGRAWHEMLSIDDVDVEPLDFRELTGGYGGPHCSSQVLVRK
jgi:arginine deiminase